MRASPAIFPSDNREAQARERLKRAPTPRPSGVVTNGRVARELPVASALLIRLELAQWLTLAQPIANLRTIRHSHSQEAVRL